MLAALEEAYANEAPIAVTLWQPHWAYAQYDLKALEDPKKSYGGGDDIMWMSPKGFGEEHPEVTQMLDTWHMSHDQLADLMLTIENVGDPTQGAKQWIHILPLFLLSPSDRANTPSVVGLAIASALALGRSICEPPENRERPAISPGRSEGLSLGYWN